MQEYKSQIRRIPLSRRLRDSQQIVNSLVREDRRPRMSLPIRPTDEDVFLATTLADALELISLIGCHAVKGGECDWKECPKRKGHKDICPLRPSNDDE